MNLAALARGVHGSVAWDLAGLAGKGAADDVLHAYGEAVDRAAIARFGEIFALYGRIWRAYTACLTGDTVSS